MKTSPLFGDLVGGRRNAPHCVCWLLPQVRRCLFGWLLSLGEGGLRMRLDLLKEYAYGSF